LLNPYHFRGIIRVKHPQISQQHILHPKNGSSLHQKAAFELLYAKIGSRVALLKKKKQKTKNYKTIHRTRGVSTSRRIRTHYFWQDLPDYHPCQMWHRFMYNCVTFANGWSYSISTTLADSINTAMACLWLMAVDSTALSQHHLLGVPPANVHQILILMDCDGFDFGISITSALFQISSTTEGRIKTNKLILKFI